MSKSAEEQREKRLKEIADLVKQRDAINARLNFLTGLVDSTSTKAGKADIPEGFSYSREVEILFSEKPQLRILEATSLLQKKFSQYTIDRRKVHSALVYLAERGKAKKVAGERALFEWVGG